MALLTAGLKSEFAFLCFLLLIDRRKSRFPAARDWEDGTLAANISWEKREQNTVSILGIAFINHSVQLLWLWLPACLCSSYAWPGVLGSWSKGNMDIDSKAHPSIHPSKYLLCVYYVPRTMQGNRNSTMNKALLWKNRRLFQTVWLYPLHLCLTFLWLSYLSCLNVNLKDGSLWLKLLSSYDIQRPSFYHFPDPKYYLVRTLCFLVITGLLSKILISLSYTVGPWV